MTLPETSAPRALVTGAAGDIGAAVVAELAKNGAMVVAADRRLPGAGLSDHSGVRPIVMDVRDPAAVDAVVDEAVRVLGGIDVLVNVAGVLAVGPVMQLRPTEWNETFAVNAAGVFHTSQAVARHMIKQRSGSIVTVSSNSAGVPRSGMAAYAASKAAATHFTRCLGLELAPFGIRCNVVSPGSTDTPMLRSMWTEQGAEDRTLHGDPENFRIGIPLGRIADPADIADAVAFLVSPKARHITMQELFVDGGAALAG